MLPTRTSSKVLRSNPRSHAEACRPSWIGLRDAGWRMKDKAVRDDESMAQRLESGSGHLFTVISQNVVNSRL